MLIFDDCLEFHFRNFTTYSLGTLALTKDGSQKRIKDTGELAKKNRH